MHRRSAPACGILARAPGAAFTLALALAHGVALHGCSGTQKGPEHESAGAGTGAGATRASGPDAGAAPSRGESARWASLTPRDLERIVSEAATARLHDAAPAFDMARLPDYAANLGEAPELSGRAVERLLDLALVELAAGHNENVERIVTVVRARARNRNSAYTGATALAEARRRQAGPDRAAQQRAIEAVFRELPVQRFNAATVLYQLYQRPQQLTARLGVVQRSMVTMETARDALYYSVVLPEIVANRDTYLAAVGTIRTEHVASPAREPYTFSTVDLAGASDAREVRAAVWDLGTDLERFGEQAWTNPGEQPNGRDDDGNGQVDDVHGLVFDDGAPNTALVYDPGAETIMRYAGYLRGVMDIRAGLPTTPAAQQVLQLLASVSDAEQQRALDRRLNAISEWAHGTHVAGVLLAGVPTARLMAFRAPWLGERRVYEDRGPTDEEVEAEHASMRAVAEYVRAQRVRVANLSISFSRDHLENALRHETQRYHSDEEVRGRAREVHARRRAFWEETFAACPDTLFVVAAGNLNEDVVEYDDLPASVAAPNVLVAGAVDRWGDWAVFTNSSPERVPVFDLGVEVESVIPNGDRVPLSGTSMSTPNVANLALKALALNPELTPAQLTALIVETGDPVAAPYSGRIPNEARAIERVRAQRPGGTQTPRATQPSRAGQPAQPGRGRGRAPRR